MKRTSVALTILLLSTISIAKGGDRHPIEYYWGVATDTGNAAPFEMSQELFVGTRSFDPKEQIVTDDQLALSEKKELRPQTYVFNLKNKTVTSKASGKVTGTGTIRSYELKGHEISKLVYDYKTESYTYEGQDLLLGVSGVPGFQVNRERGIVSWKDDNGVDQSSTFEIVYTPITQKEYEQRKKALEKAAKKK